MRMRLPAVLLGALLGLAACEPPVSQRAAGPGPNPYPPIPPAQAEQPPLPPVSEQQLVWRPGEWVWEGAGYVWHHGAYEVLGNHSKQYQPGYWAPQATGWVWVPGHWL